MIASIIIAIRGEKIKHINLFFFIVGGMACFIDFLTVPIISLGLPLTIYFLKLQKVRKLEWKETLKTIFFASLSWGIAYGTIWFAKWALVDIIYHRGLITTALKQVNYRSFEEKIVYLKTLEVNFYNIKPIIIYWVIFAIARTNYKLYKI